MTVDIPEELVFLGSLDSQENISADGSDLLIRVPEVASCADVSSEAELRVAVFESTGSTGYDGEDLNGVSVDFPGEEAMMAPVKEQQQYEQVEVIDVGAEGDGIIKIDGFVVFIPDGYGLLGQRVDIEITEVKETHADAKIVSTTGGV